MSDSYSPLPPSAPEPQPVEGADVAPAIVRPKPAAGKSALAAAAMAVLAKAKWLLVAAKGLKFGQLLLTMGSMFAMIWFEAVRFGWLYGVGFVALIFIHEMGHAVAIRRAGLAAGYPVFIPFVGAMISLKGQIRSPKEEATIALAGPIAGAAAAALCAGIYLLTGQRLFLALANVGFFLNLFNMIPLPPLDGGRAATVFTRKAWWIGLGLLFVVFLVTRAPQILLIGIFALMNGFRSATGHLDAPPEVRRDVAATFFGLCGFLAVGVYLTTRALSSG